MERVREAHSVAVEGEHLCGLSWHRGLLWYSDARLDEIVAVDPDEGAVVHRISCPKVRTGLTISHDGRAFIQVVEDDKRLRYLDPETGETLEELPNWRPGGELCGLHDTPGGLWAGYQRPGVVELRAHGSPATSIAIAMNEDVADLTMMEDYVVAANHPDQRLNVIDPRQRRVVAVIPVAGTPTGVTWDGRRLWYCDHGSGRLQAVDPEGWGPAQ